jgi:hypothetical protein
VDFAESSSSTASTLPAGSSSAWKVSIPSFSATSRATSFRSPVSITVFLTPSFFRAAIAEALSSLMRSLITMWPAYFPSTATWIMVPGRWQSCHFAPMLSIIFEFPTQTLRPSTFARMPWPAISSTSLILHPSVASFGKAARRASPIGWVE